MKPIATRKKLPVQVHQELIEDQEQPKRLDTDGLSGEGAESALAHLRDQENKRIDRAAMAVLFGGQPKRPDNSSQ